MLNVTFKTFNRGKQRAESGLREIVYFLSIFIIYLNSVIC